MQVLFPENLVLETETFTLVFYLLKGRNGASQVALEVKSPPAKAGDLRVADSISGLGRFPAEEMATHSSILAWETSWTEEPGGLQSMGPKGVGHD